MRALVVDDIEMNRELIGMYLEGKAAVIYAGSGEDALTQADKALTDGKYFDLVCLDISMPGIDGHETLRQLRELEASHNSMRATVFMVTGSSSPDDMFEALMNGGCDDYLTKPIMQQSFNELLIKHGL